MPDDAKPVSLYQHDFNAWALQQAEALRIAANQAADAATLRVLDWENLAEEIEGLAQRDRRELASRIALIVEHLVKLEHSPARNPRAGWISTVGNARREAHAILRDSPSLRRHVPALISQVAEGAERLAMRSLADHGEKLAAGLASLKPHYTEDQILGECWPDPAGDLGGTPQPARPRRRPRV